jgi:D-glycero-alpha-D-manno-heptose-7-phosphate kinase
MRKPLHVINSVAPIRICDNGGWTDTWFARHGTIFNIGVYPYAEVQIEVFASAGDAERIIINAENYGERYVMHPEANGWIRHPLLEAAIERMHVPQQLGMQVTIFSEAPAGASTGTSAAVAVALVGALDCLTPGRLSAHETAYTAHAIEVEMLHRQSGIQDQLCSAYGGINYIEMFEYPRAAVSPLQVSNDIWWELERRLVLIYLGRSHDSSQIHEKVIRELEDAGPDCRQLNDLRRTAALSRDALLAGDFAALGRAMCDNTEAQGRLDAELVSSDAARVIEIARAHGAAGWKVNGAGGEGGSLTILAGPLSYQKREMIRSIEAESRMLRNIPIYLSRHGLRVWEQKQ